MGIMALPVVQGVNIDLASEEGGRLPAAVLRNLKGISSDAVER